MGESEIGKITFEISPELKKSFKKICIDEDIKEGAQLVELVRGYVQRMQKISRNI